MNGLLVFIEMIQINQCPSHQSILLTQEPIHEIFTKKYWELAELENDLFFRRPFWIFFFKKKKKLHHLNENKQPVHMRYHLFLHYEWFLQNLGKDFIRTNMHTTVTVAYFVIFMHKSAFRLCHEFWNPLILYTVK